VLHRDLAFIDRNERGSVFILDGDVENRPAHGDDRGWRPDFVVVRLASDFLDLDFYVVKEDL